MQVLASQLPFLANRNAEQAVPPLFWPVNCIKIGRHVALLSGPSVYVYSVAREEEFLPVSAGRQYFISRVERAEFWMVYDYKFLVQA